VKLKQRMEEERKRRRDGIAEVTRRVKQGRL